MSAQTIHAELDRIEAELAKAKQEVQSALELIRQHQADKAGLHEELAREKRQNAARREALLSAKRALADAILFQNDEFAVAQSKCVDALSDTAGAEYISKELVKPLAEALKMAYYEINAIHARCGVPWWDTGKSDVTQEYFTSVVEASRSALVLAKSLGLITP